MKNEAIQETSKMYLFCWTSQRICESKIQRIKPYNWPDGPPAGDRLGKIAEAVRWLLCEIWIREIRKWGQSSIVSEEGGWRSLSLHWKYVHGGWRALSFHWNSKITSRQWNEKKGNLQKKGGWGQLCLSIWSQIWQKSSVKKEKQERRTHKGSQKVQWICLCIGNVKSGCFGLDVFVFSFGNAKSGWDGEGSSVNHKLAIIDPGSQSFSLHWK